MAKGPNPNQQKVMETTEGPLLVIAGPGSGKTYTLVERIIHLVIDKKVDPQNLLIATFTEKAAKELITRISNRLIDIGASLNINEMYVGTIHSICLRILEENREHTRLKRNFTLMDQFDQQYFIYRNLKEFEDINNIKLITDGTANKFTPSRWTQSENLIKWLNKVSEEALDVHKLIQASEPLIKALGDAWVRYQELLRANNALDFSTIQIETFNLIENNQAILNKLREQIHYLMIDEYQDTNTVQELILLAIAGEHKNICVVGDDDQGLYRFRGATIRNILEFPQNFAIDSCNQERLEINYRSHPDIVQFYNKWMKQLDWRGDGKLFRFPKTIVPDTKEFSQIPAVIRVSGVPGQDNWHKEVLEFLTSLKETALTGWNQVAFLFRSVKNDKVIALADFLESHGIPVYSPRSNLFFQREEIRLVIGAMLFLFRRYPEIRQWDPDITLDIWSYYDNECFRPFAEELIKSENVQLLKWCQKYAREHYNLTTNKDYGFSGLFYQLLQFPLFQRYLGDHTDNGVMDGRPARNMAIFSQMLVKFEYIHHVSVLNPKFIERNLLDLFNQFFRFLQDGGINEYEDDSQYAPTGCVSFLTIHQSKGLEFPIVMVGSLEGVPRKQYDDIDELLQNNYYRKAPFEPLVRTKEFDFWRLYYTAFSRAQNVLALTCQEQVAHAKGERNVPSKYFKPIYHEVESWRSKKFDISKLDLDLIKDVTIKQEYSFTSHIALFENCALQYRFFKDLGFSPVRQSPILFGTLIHQTIEDVHKAVLTGQESSVKSEQVEDWFNANYNYLTQRERVYLAPEIKKVALGHVLRYVERYSGNWGHIRQAEFEVALVKDEYILKGKIDLIQGQGETVEIVDFKSEKKPDLATEQEKVDRYKRQLEIYSHVVEERLGYKVSKMHLYYTSEEDGNPFISFNKSAHSINKTIAVVDETVRRIEKKDYQISERPIKHCADCDIRHYCDTK